MTDVSASRRSHDQGFVRTTISVPQDLKRRMDRVAANWSAVAGEAFEEHLKHTPTPRKQQEAPTMSDDDAIERLRRLKAVGEADARTAEPGFDAGRRWAMGDVHPAELARLEQYFA